MVAKRMPDRRYGHFRDDQIVFLVTHNQEKIGPNELDFLKKRVDPTLDDYLKTALNNGEATVEIKWLDSQVFSFPKPTSFELEQLEGILNDMKTYKEYTDKFNPSNYRSKIFDPQDQSKVGFSLVIGNMSFGRPEDQKNFDPLKLIGLIKRLREEIKNKELFNGLLMVKNISPNWLIGNGSQGGATGGPGGLPKPFKGTDQDGARQAKFNIQDKLGELYSTGENVDVAILDTVPCPHDLVIAHKEGKKNPLIQTLLGPKGKLRLHWATYEQLFRMYNTSFDSHDYRMSDHGIFAAGIIHSIVPDATIHLIEVLNPFGVGDLITLAEGFHRVFHEIYRQAGPERKLVVNCSLMLELPIVDEHRYADNLKVPAKDKEPADDVEDVNFEQEVLDFVNTDPDVVLEINELCKLLFAAGRQVVAAAGNDWENGKARKRRRSPGNSQPPEPRRDAPRARYPAGFASVVGAGALPRDSKKGQNRHKASTYSNLGDMPEGDAIMTLGGEEGEKNGVLGLYLSDQFPKRERMNTHNDKNSISMYLRKSDPDETKTEDNRWAWWCGTSFAAPVLTGTIAAVLSSSSTPGNTQRAVHALYTAGAISDGANPGAETTDAGEDVMFVTQDDPLPVRP